jgi:hypothetical protein
MDPPQVDSMKPVEQVTEDIRKAVRETFARLGEEA